MWADYPDNERDRLIDKEANKLLAWCLSIFFGLFVVVAVIAAIL